MTPRGRADAQGQIRASSRENLSLVFFDQVRLKLACSATEASKSHGIVAIATRDILLSMQ